MANDRSLEGMTILIVEDIEQVRKAVCLFLQDEGCQILEAEDGIHALEICRTHFNLIDLVFSDIKMPEMDGIEFFKNVQSIIPSTKFVFTSGEPILQKIKNELPEAVLIPKPYSPGELVHVFCEVLGREFRHLLEREHPNWDFSFLKPSHGYEEAPPAKSQQVVA
jgi:CheY-like chemotaxis protein